MLMWMKDIDQHTKGLPESMDKAYIVTKTPLFLASYVVQGNRVTLRPVVSLEAVRVGRRAVSAGAARAVGQAWGERLQASPSMVQLR